MQKSDIFSILLELGWHISRAKVNGAYKRKAQKVRPMDLGESDGCKPSRVSDWVAKSKEENVRGHEEKYPS